MDPELQQICDVFRAQLANCPSSWCQLHPHDDDRQWSAQQLMEHLVLALRTSSRVLETRVRRGRPTRSKSTLLERVLRFLILSRRRMPLGAAAPPFVRPGALCWPPMDGAELSDIFRQEMEAMDRLLVRCEELFGRRAPATHYLLGPLRPMQWRRFHIIHCRHHLEQLHRIQQELGHAGPARPTLISAGKITARSERAAG
ncbi:MAG TPA: hypothetical protein VME18_03505 [Acidobacteriaceae bacterium]|nr:hypothetical protein [Acidobacteriaceae bacterium]